MRASAPANLLLLGEYAVTEEGGLGLALACAPRVGVEALLSDREGIRVEGRMGGADFSWTEDAGEPNPLLAALVSSARRRLGAGLPGLELRIDSSAFFGPDGAKLGFGSSAAVAVAMSAVLLGSGGLSDGEIEASVFRLALEAHRAAQGGLGSGYDVAASRYGGIGRFVGGREPRWEALETSLLPRLFLVPGRGPVRSSGAVAKYRALAEANSEWVARYVDASNRIVSAFIEEKTQSGRVDRIAGAAENGVRLGDRIGVPARLPMPNLPGVPGAQAALKALGAGDELGIIAAFGATAEACAVAGLREILIQTRGLEWEAA